MNYRMSKTWNVLANVVWEDQILCNDYRIRVDWTTATDDSDEQNIAFERVKYWLFDVMEHSVLVNQDHKRLTQLQATGQRVIAIPGDPIDPVIAMMLLTKFVAVTEGRMIFSEISVASEQGRHVQYLQGMDEDFLMFAETGWWRDSGPVWHAVKAKRSNKIVNLDRVPEWSDLKLAWDGSVTKTDGHVVFAEFNKSAD
jgi:hypothetical protein